MGGGHAVEVAHQAGCSEAGVVAGDDGVAFAQPVRQVLIIARGTRQRGRGAVVTEADGAVRPRDDREPAFGRRAGRQEHRARADRGLVVLVDRGVEHAVRGAGAGERQRGIQRHGRDGGSLRRYRAGEQARIEPGPVRHVGTSLGHRKNRKCQHEQHRHPRRRSPQAHGQSEPDDQAFVYALVCQRNTATRLGLSDRRAQTPACRSASATPTASCVSLCESCGLMMNPASKVGARGGNT